MPLQNNNIWVYLQPGKRFSNIAEIDSQQGLTSTVNKPEYFINSLEKSVLRSVFVILKLDLRMITSFQFLPSY